MQRITITVDDELIVALDSMISEHGYQNRSEAIRDLARAGMAQMQAQSNAKADTVAALVYVYDHHARELAKRVTRSFHDRHDLSMATMHVHLDHASCLEVALRRARSMT
jgi:CopG family nickel-responsive transcriptional regulator